MQLTDASSTKQKVEAALSSGLAALNPDNIFRTSHPAYTKTPEQNLVPTVDISDFWEDLLQGDGNELEDGATRPAKFCATFSSSAIAVNTFGFFRNRPELLSLLGFADFTECQFERKLNTGISTPNLDFFAAGSSAIVCVEAKCTEPLSRKTARFSPRYSKVVDKLADSSWRRLYAELVDYPDLFQHLDAAQLVKHYLGMRHSIESAGETLILLYLYWEPLNPEVSPELIEHRRELVRFSQMTGNGDVQFASMTYSELFSVWRENRTPEVIEHVQNLSPRYEIRI